MPLTSQQIVTNALQIAKVPGFTSQAGQALNMVLSELCQNYDFDLAKTIYNFAFGGLALGYGPYYLPTDFLRCAKDDLFYTISGVPYVLINIDNSEFDSLVQQPGLNSYPSEYTVVFDSTGLNPPALYVWPPPSGAFPVTVRYYRQMPDITTPETSATIPWFPDTNYLITRVAGEMMKFTDDDRISAFLGTGEYGAQGILDRYLKLKDSDEDRVKRVTLDRRMFGSDRSRLPNTKTIGW